MSPAEHDALSKAGPGSLAATAGRCFDSTESLGNATTDTAEGSETASSVAHPPPRPRSANTPITASGQRVPLLPWATVQAAAQGCSVASSEGSVLSARRSLQGGPAWCDRTPPAGRTPASARRGSAPTPLGGAAGSSAPRPAPAAFAPAPRGDVMVCVRLRPGPQDDTCVAAVAESPGVVRMRQPASSRYEASEAHYQYDITFGPEASQEQVYDQAVAPICGAVIQGYNGAVIAYGQTGSGKTHTVVGNARSKGVAPRAVAAIFAALEKCQCWAVDVSVLEIYNERVRDLLAPGPGVSHVEIHEVKGDGRSASFRCPDATHRRAAGPEDALQALTEGMKRRETARTDMNHSSSRSHLIFTLTVTQSDQELGATLRGRLHLVDLAGSERLKRSMASDQSPYRSPSKGASSRTPRDQRREAGEINKSLSQLALVIQRLTNANSSLQMVPYRDSMLTRLLAESFGGSSKTCLVITCSAQVSDREETRCSLDFGKRAKLVKNKAEINLEVACEPSPVVQALVAKEIEDLKQEKEEALRQKAALQAELVATRERLQRSEACTSEAVADLLANQERNTAEVRSLEEQKGAVQRRWIMAATEAAETQDASIAEVARLQRDQAALHEQLVGAVSELADSERERALAQRVHDEAEAELRARIAEQQDSLEDRGQQLAGLSEQLSELRHAEAAALAELRVREAALRAQWQDDVSRLEREKLSMASQFEEERARLERRLSERLREVVESPPADRRAAVAEAEARARQAEEEGGRCEARLAERGAALRGALRVATADSGHLDDARRERLAALEEQAAELRRRWARIPVAGVAPAAPAEPEAIVAQLDLTALDEPLAARLEAAADAAPAAQDLQGLDPGSAQLRAEEVAPPSPPLSPPATRLFCAPAPLPTSPPTCDEAAAEEGAGAASGGT